MGFLAMLAKWLLSNPWRMATIGAGLFLGFTLLWRVPHLEDKVKDQTILITQLNGDIKLQNSQVQNWKDRASEAAANQKQAMALADKAMVRAQQTVTQIEKEQVPTPDKECAATLDLLRKYQ